MQKDKQLFSNFINDQENSEKLIPLIEDIDSNSDEENFIYSGNFSSKRKTKMTSKAKEKSTKPQKYHDDIVHILKYAEENNPHSLIVELCQNLKWTFPNINSYEISENNVNVYKTQVNLKSFNGEAIGITKKISKSKIIFINYYNKEKACTELLVRMIEDKTVRDSLRMYIDTKAITRDCQLKEEGNEDEIKIDEEHFEKPVYKDSDLDLTRVKQIITDYNKDVLNNPLGILDAFRNRYNIPVSFTYTIKEKLHKAVNYVGGKIFGIGVDANIRVAKYRAAEEAVKKIKEKYGEESLKYKGLERRKNKFRLIEEEKIKTETSMEPIPLKSLQFQSNEEISQNVDQLFSKCDVNSLTLQDLEIFLLKFERFAIPTKNYLEIHKFLSLIFYSNKTLSIHFKNPVLAGSFLYDCPNVFNQTVDIIFYHSLKQEEIKDAIEILIKKIKQLLNFICSEFVIKIKNRINETNLDVLIKLKNKDYSLRLLIRDDEYKQFIYYIKVHNTKVNNQVQFSINFNLMRRIFRIWRRHHKLNFLKPEILDWLIKHCVKDSLGSSLINILNTCSKNLKKIFYENSEIPDLLKEDFESITEEQMHEIKNSMKLSLAAIVKGDFNDFLKLN